DRPLAQSRGPAGHNSVADGTRARVDESHHPAARRESSPRHRRPRPERAEAVARPIEQADPWIKVPHLRPQGTRTASQARVDGVLRTSTRKLSRMEHWCGERRGKL